MASSNNFGISSQQQPQQIQQASLDWAYPELAQYQTDENPYQAGGDSIKKNSHSANSNALINNVNFQNAAASQGGTVQSSQTPQNGWVQGGKSQQSSSQQHQYMDHSYMDDMLKHENSGGDTFSDPFFFLQE